MREHISKSISACQHDIWQSVPLVVCGVKTSRSPVHSQTHCTHQQQERQESRKKKSRFLEEHFSHVNTSWRKKKWSRRLCSVGSFSRVRSHFEMWLAHWSTGVRWLDFTNAWLYFSPLWLKLLLPCLTFLKQAASSPQAHPHQWELFVSISLPPPLPHPNILTVSLVITVIGSVCFPAAWRSCQVKVVWLGADTTLCTAQGQTFIQWDKCWGWESKMSLLQKMCHGWKISPVLILILFPDTCQWLEWVHWGWYFAVWHFFYWTFNSTDLHWCGYVSRHI